MYITDRPQDIGGGEAALSSCAGQKLFLEQTNVGGFGKQDLTLAAKLNTDDLSGKLERISPKEYRRLIGPESEYLSGCAGTRLAHVAAFTPWKYFQPVANESNAVRQGLDSGPTRSAGKRIDEIHITDRSAVGHYDNETVTRRCVYGDYQGDSRLTAPTRPNNLQRPFPDRRIQRVVRRA